MNYRALALGAFVGFLVALSPSCGGDTECGPANCNGCCSAENECVDSATQTALTCGNGGNSCVACTGAETCEAGACKAPTNVGTDAGDGGGGNCGNKCENQDGTCSNITCTSGCCGFTSSGAAQCKGGADINACGRGSATQAAKCDDCGGKGEQCDTASRTCQGASAVGLSCTTNADCSELGANGICKTSTTGLPDGGGQYPYNQGYCTIDCGTDPNVCPADSVCIPYGSQFQGGILNEAQDICARRCDFATVQTYFDWKNLCGRPGFLCVGLTDATGDACIVDPPPEPDFVGMNCANDDECRQGLPPWIGLCLTEREELADGGVGDFTGTPGGNCTTFCNRTAYADKHHECGEGLALCVGISETDPSQGICYPGCEGMETGQGTCKAGYSCWAGVSSVNPEAPPEGICYNNCNSAGAECQDPTVQRCDTGTGYCCVDYWVTDEVVNGENQLYPSSGTSAFGTTTGEDGGTFIELEDAGVGPGVLDAGTTCQTRIGIE